MQWIPCRFELLGGLDAFPGAGDLDQDPLAIDPRLLVHADQLLGLGDGRLGIKAQTGVDLGRDPSGDDLEDLAAERDEQLVHELRGLRLLVPPLLARLLQRLLDQVRIVRLLGGVEEQRRIGRCVLRLELRDGLDVTRVRNHGGVLLE